MIEVFPYALLCLPHGDTMEVVMKLSTALRGDGHQGLSVTTVDDLPTSSFDLSSGLLATAWLEMGHHASDLPNGSLVVAELSSDVGIDLLSTMVSHPVTGLPMSLGGAIVSLDSVYHWADTAIVSWLDDLGY
jgi:hypothetical protein